MCQFLDRMLEDLLRAVVHGLTHANLLLGKVVCGSVVVHEVKLVVIEVFTKTDMVDCVGEQPFKLDGNVDSGFPVLFDFRKPLVTMNIQMLFEDADHHLNAFLVESM